MMNKKGLFIVLEGGEGSGKTTISKKLQQVLEESGYNTLLTREPGGDPVSEMIRNVIIHSDDIDPFTQLVLIAASRKRNIDLRIKPALEKNDIVICDRFGLSTIIYQGIVQGISLIDIYKVFAATGLHLIKPDIEIVLNVDPKVGLNRVMTNDREVSAIDRKGLEFHTKVNEAYLKHSYRNESGYRFDVDANRELDDVFTNVVNLVTQVLETDDRFKITRKCIKDSE